jgi:HD-GYP domain-containing protein (c-di-GMP phosphodiesterase class II)
MLSADVPRDGQPGLSVALDERDRPTQEHSNRVSRFCDEIGRACGLTSHDLGLLQLASILHDVGKIGIPDEVLKKPGKFDASDWEIMKTHSERGQRIILATGMEDATEIARIVRHHHERIDGRGYPDGLAGESIPILARIVAVADAYDAMARLRPYGTRRTHGEIMDELQREAGSQHDPYLVTKLAAIIESSQFRAG